MTAQWDTILLLDVRDARYRVCECEHSAGQHRAFAVVNGIERYVGPGRGACTAEDCVCRRLLPSVLNSIAASYLAERAS